MGRSAFLNTFCRYFFSSKQACGVFKASVKATDMVTPFAVWRPILTAMLRAIELSDDGIAVESDMKCGSVSFTRVVSTMVTASKEAIAMVAVSLFPPALSAEDAVTVGKISGAQKLQYAVEGVAKAVAAAVSIIRTRHAELEVGVGPGVESTPPGVIVLM